jgi:hypothetical protein
LPASYVYVVRSLCVGTQFVSSAARNLLWIASLSVHSAASRRVGHDDIPHGAGVRVLSISGDGTQGLSAGILLQKIEEQLGIGICDLFDLIVGIDSGALSALGYGRLRLSGVNMVEVLHKAMLEMMEHHIETSGSEAILFYHRAVGKRLSFPNKCIFAGSQMPRVAIDVPSGYKNQNICSCSYKFCTQLMCDLAGKSFFPRLQAPRTMNVFEEIRTLWGDTYVDIILATSITNFFFFFGFLCLVLFFF